MSLSTHVLDSVQGRPAEGVPVRLDKGDRLVGTGATDQDGRLRDWLPDGEPGRGVYRLTFDTAAYFSDLGVKAFYPEVVITFVVDEPDAHYHVPLLLSPFAYSTYRGS
ncbi:hydroxyisourate hydrolase [Sphaerisporangium sp. TRM90804]|uniref:hydroxyisourate hydrolase n=1 Tax=Sphaerisporangium sp. TRM90804 TaxID=3031113 RepID=UPI00244B1BDA|nr:hydroxyisourate hydrolase [Sphaerisporangium sp. TRM90804]MDH2428705.1 hydroxyisourate hydrolase [Sphaerisporangium sp. TRM90804]